MVSNAFNLFFWGLFNPLFSSFKAHYPHSTRCVYVLLCTVLRSDQSNPHQTDRIDRMNPCISIDYLYIYIYIYMYVCIYV